MIRDVRDAHELLGDRLERKIAHATKLVRVTDRVAAMRLHDTFIAWYGANGCLVNVGEWNTRTTWRRINDFTPATPRGHHLLRYVVQPNGDQVLYQPDIRIDPDGTVTNPMLPSRQRRIEKAARDFLRDAKAYARTAVSAWDCYANEDCSCERTPAADLTPDHFLAHVEARDSVLPHKFQFHARKLAETQAPDEVCTNTRKAFTTWLIKNFLPVAIWAADPDYELLTPNLPYHA